MRFLKVLFFLIGISFLIFACGGGGGGSTNNSNGQFPNIIGIYSGSYTIHLANCSDPSVNGTYVANAVFNISNQDESSFSGSGTGSFEGALDTENITISGTIDLNGNVSGNTSHTFADTGGKGTFTGQLNGNTLTIINNGADTYGDICTYTRDITVSR